jgi:hypothetical protein
MRRALGLWVASLVLPSLTLVAANARGPSTPEERAKALALIQQMETDPLGVSKEDRQRLAVWLVEVPDIHVSLCTQFFPTLLDGKSKHGGDLAMQSAYSMAAYEIEHPDQAKDENALYLAGIEGTLRAYESILRKEPKSREPSLDELLAKRQSGELAAFVRDTSPKCKGK